MYRRRLRKSEGLATVGTMMKMRRWRMLKVMEIHQNTTEVEAAVQAQMPLAEILEKRELVQERVALMADERRS
jgi:hypothetical protein